MNDTQLPILKDTKDPHYRYKMPKLTAKVEGNGNGIKTVITNMVAIAKALGRPPSYPTKYFGCELGAQVAMNNEIYVVNGSHDEAKLINLLYSFINKFVLCQKCKNPETSLSVSTSKQIISQKCIACGHEATINKSIHKLTTFILNHPPDNVNGDAKSKGGKVSKSEKKAKKGSGGTSNPNGNNSPTNESPLIEDGGNDLGDDDFDENEFTTEEYSKRMSELCINKDIYKNDMKKESYNLFYKLLKEKKEANVLLETQIQKELVEEAKKLDIKDKAPLVLCELLFTENMFEEIKKYKMLFLRFCVENKKAQKYLLGGYEKLIGDIYKDKLFNNAVKILKQLYDEEILDEDVIIEWSAKESKKYVSKEMSKKIREKIAPLVKWLKEAEEEDSEEDDEQDSDEKNAKKNVSNAGSAKLMNGKQESVESDDDVEIDFSHRVTEGIKMVSSKPVVVVPVNADVATNNEAVVGQDDIDIDNI